MSDGGAPRPVGNRFPRSLRLKSPWTIRHIFREGVRRKGHGYVVYGIPSTRDSRLGVVVSTRFGRGVKRNRLRRRLREAARLNRAHWPDHMDLVVRAIDGSPAEMEFTKLVSDVARTFGKLTISTP
ncbi:MAG: hypothetical protein Kow0074_18000 [Candidatus Zixiibacteriota bacterium]